VLQVIIVLPTTYPVIDDMMSKQHADSKKLNRECLLKILSNLQFLARQGMAIRGDGDEADSNFIQLLNYVVEMILELKPVKQNR